MKETYIQTDRFSMA